jgi:hypothetical protein
MSIRLSYALLPSLLTLTMGLMPVAVAAQVLYNDGGVLVVKPGALLTIGGDFELQGLNAVFNNEGTVRVAGNVNAVVGSVFNLNTGELEVRGNFTQLGYLDSAPTGRLVMSGANNQTLITANGRLGTLILDKPVPGRDTLRLLSNVALMGNVELRAGMVRTVLPSALILLNTATLTGEANGRYVQGGLVSIRTSVSGNLPIDFQNGFVLNPNGQNLGPVVVDRYAGVRKRGVTYAESPTQPGHQSIDQIWQVNTGYSVTTPVSLTMNWLSDNDNGLAPTDFARATAWHANNATSSWLPILPYQDARARSLTVPTLLLAQRWTVATANAPLPVELISFDATRSGTAARLSWATASESNSAYFEVETSTTGRDFRPVTAIGHIAAHGTTTERHTYSALDPALLTYSADPVYYRLRQVDLDGTATYSEVRALRIGGAQPIKLTATIWPNPSVASTGAQLHLTLPTVAPVELTLLDAIGRVVRQQVVTPVAPGAQSFAVPGAETDVPLAAGVYLVQVRQGAETVTQRLLRE